MGKSPGTVWSGATHVRDLDDKTLRDAFTTRDKRRVRKDSTVAV